MQTRLPLALRTHMRSLQSALGYILAYQGFLPKDNALQLSKAKKTTICVELWLVSALGIPASSGTKQTDNTCMSTT